MRRIIFPGAAALACLFLLFLALGCGGAAQEPEQGREVLDTRGHAVHILKKPERILTLSIYTDEIALGLITSDKLVAVSRFLDDPKESVVVEKARKIPEKVGDPTVEQIVAWHPDVVFATPWTSPDQVAALEDLKIPVIVCGPSDSYEEVQANIRLMAAGLWEEERGEKLVAAMDEVEREIASKIARIPENERKSVVLLSVMTNYGGAGSAFDDMCKHAGVTNASAAIGVQNGESLAKELLVKSNPDLLLLPNYDDKGAFDTQKFIDGYLNDPALKSMKAIQNRALFYPREGYIYNGSQDFVFGIQEVAFCAYGEAFCQEDNRHLSFSGE
jgi:iron complex transport system substrate-binding protein